ncbi:hypothetical protein NH287_07175 [Microbacterium sp. CnD16-F]|uniref:hypothetical protein n=1 Tax=Microbacterium TaxID=33882 RepID=UPI0010F4A968|nr:MULTISPECIES: hypothetical protein [Microbacterium]MCO7203274.1 hypothetical protein [Microbacterium sp. CnD16-F]MDT0116277.1 hypothetical protein [Microbacterium sp. PRF11]
MTTAPGSRSHSSACPVSTNDPAIARRSTAGSASLTGTEVLGFDELLFVLDCHCKRLGAFSTSTTSPTQTVAATESITRGNF